jgi:hypothetical protein
VPNVRDAAHDGCQNRGRNRQKPPPPPYGRKNIERNHRRFARCAVSTDSSHEESTRSRCEIGVIHRALWSRNGPIARCALELVLIAERFIATQVHPKEIDLDVVLCGIELGSETVGSPSAERGLWTPATWTALIRTARATQLLPSSLVRRLR